MPRAQGRVEDDVAGAEGCEATLSSMREGQGDNGVRLGPADVETQVETSEERNDGQHEDESVEEVDTSGFDEPALGSTPRS